MDNEWFNRIYLKDVNYHFGVFFFRIYASKSEVITSFQTELNFKTVGENSNCVKQRRSWLLSNFWFFNFKNEHEQRVLRLRIKLLNSEQSTFVSKMLSKLMAEFHFYVLRDSGTLIGGRKLETVQILTKDS